MSISNLQQTYLVWMQCFPLHAQPSHGRCYSPSSWHPQRASAVWRNGYWDHVQPNYWTVWQPQSWNEDLHGASFRTCLVTVTSCWKMIQIIFNVHRLGWHLKRPNTYLLINLILLFMIKFWLLLYQKTTWNAYFEGKSNNRIYNWLNVRAQRTRARQLRAPFTATLILILISMQYMFNSCSFNYKLDYNIVHNKFK